MSYCSPHSGGQRPISLIWSINDHEDVAQLVEISNAGHALIVEQPEIVGQSVVSFLLAVDGATATSSA
jgi:pimeloyl-ACP methyl ester carboxylesterase